MIDENQRLYFIFLYTNSVMIPSEIAAGLFVISRRQTSINNARAVNDGTS